MQQFLIIGNCKKRGGRLGQRENRGDIDPVGVANLHTLSTFGAYSKFINGLRVATSGAFVC